MKIKWLIIPLFVLLNYLVAQAPNLQLDFTKNKLHSLSDATKSVAAELKSDIEIKVFLSQDIPAEARSLSSDLKNILAELANANKQKIKLSYVDPIKDEKAREEAAKYGIQQLQFSSIKSDKFEVQNGYFGLVVKIGDKYEVIPVANDVGSLEYTIVSGIKKLTSDKLPSVALSTDVTAVDKIQYFNNFLGRNFKVVEATLDGDKALPEEAQTLVIVGRSLKIDDKGIAKLEKWLDAGKGVIAFVDKIDVGAGLTSTKIPDTGLEKVFEKRGIKFQNGLILDASSAVANFRSQAGAFVVQYPYWVNIMPENIDRSIPALSGLNTLTLPWPSALTLEGKAKPIIKSSKMSNLDDSFNDLSPTTKKTLKEDAGELAVAAIRNDEVKLVVVADSDFIKDSYVQNSQNNLAFALNMVDYFSGDSSLMTIRNKTISSSPIVQVSDQQKLIIKALGIIIPVIILVISYFAINRVRKRKLTA